jgi:bifunctional UDP-N-acetylglucosamine pyrophosphorylase/glucosamine-1-phosphate N-acetyltransferase
MAEVHGVVLAAGKGTRMNSDVPKVLHECFGEPMIQHVLRALDRSDISKRTAILGTGKESVEAVLPDDVNVVGQTDQLGTGHAARQFMEETDPDSDDVVLVACGDIPGIRPSTYSRVIETVADEGDGLAVLTAEVDDPEGYGRVVTDDGDSIERIVEHDDAGERVRQINEINTGIIAARASVLSDLLPELSNDNAAGEYYLTDVVELFRERGGDARAVRADDSWEVTGINTRRQLVEFEREGHRRRNEALLDQGVTVRDPDRVKIGPWVEVERDVVLEGDVTVYGESSIGSGSRLTGRVTVAFAQLGRETEVTDSTIRHARLGDRVRVGPYCHVRPGTVVENDVRLGNFVEIKNSSVDSDTNIAHLSYVGDADVGSDVNVGAGTITCNYDGYDKHRTTIDDGVFIGSNTEMVAPVTIGEGAMIGAGSTVTKDVPPYSLSLCRAEETIREDWVEEVWRPRKEER